MDASQLARNVLFYRNSSLGEADVYGARTSNIGFPLHATPFPKPVRVPSLIHFAVRMNRVGLRPECCRISRWRCGSGERGKPDSLNGTDLKREAEELSRALTRAGVCTWILCLARPRQVRRRMRGSACEGERRKKGRRIIEPRVGTSSSFGFRQEMKWQTRIHGDRTAN